MKRLADRFVLEREVGSGGMSTVYLGRDEVLGRSVAVKILKAGFADTEIADRFQREGKTAASLSHPSIVPVYDAGEAEMDGREVAYIVMEHVPGGDLKDLLDKRGPLGARELSRIGREVSDGLAHAHDRGVIHRDIKPHNILLDNSGRPKLTDFGIARALESSRMTRTGSYLGTALYSSPEQLQGRDVTVKSDVYSLGATLYQAVAGAPPFQGSPMQVAEGHVSQEPRPPGESNPGLNGDLESLILACLSKDPDERPSAREVSSRLAAMSGVGEAAGANAGAAMVSPSGDRSRPRTERRQRGASPSRGRRSRGIFVALAVVVVLALLGAMVGPSLLGENTEESASQNTPRQDAPSQEAPSQDAQQQNVPSQDVPQQDAQQQNTPSQGVSQQQNPPQDAEAEAPEGQSDGSQEAEEAPVEQAPAEEVTVEQPEESESGLSEEAAADAVEGFYTTAANGNYDSSAEFLSTGYQSTFPNEATFEGTFSTLQRIGFVEEPEVEVSGDTATVSGVTRAVHTDRTELNTATWTLVEEGGEWKLDNIAIQDTQIV